MPKTATKEQPMLFGADAKADAKPGTPERAATAVTKAESKRKAGSTAMVVAPPIQPMEASSANLMMMIAQLARDKDADPKKMESIVAILERVKAEEARMAFTRDFIALQDVLPAINRDGKIEVRKKDARGDRTGPVQQSTPFATYPNIHKVVKPLLTAHHFAYSCWVEPGANERLTVVGVLDHVQGHSRRSMFPLPAETSGSKNNVQGWGSSASYGRRYNIIMLLNIVSEHASDSDRDGAPPERGTEVIEGDEQPQTKTARLSPEEAQAMRDKIKGCGVGEEKFCEHYGIARVEDLPPERYDEASDACARFSAAQKAAAAAQGGQGGKGGR